MNININILGFSIICILFLAIAYALIKYIIKRFIVKQNILKLLIERRTKEINQKNQELEKNNLIKTRLISIISHDLISPLKYIHLSSKQLLENKTTLDEAFVQEVILEISNSSKELELLSTNILNWIKYQNENRQLIKEEFDLREVINQICRVFHGLAKQKNVILINEFNEKQMLFQYVEPIKIVLYNLVLNAINFTNEGNIKISGGSTGRGILINVQDAGVGMTKQQIENILSEEFIVSSLNVDKRKGNGLGYLIIKDLLKLVNAKFSIKSRVGKGTKVSIFIPG